jgi:hypothetical protein
MSVRRRRSKNFDPNLATVPLDSRPEGNYQADKHAATSKEELPKQIQSCYGRYSTEDSIGLS